MIGQEGRVAKLLGLSGVCFLTAQGDLNLNDETAHQRVF